MRLPYRTMQYAGLLVAVSGTAKAQEIIRFKDLKPAMDKAVVDYMDKTDKSWKGGTADTKAFRILALRIEGAKPALENYYVSDELTGVAACS